MKLDEFIASVLHDINSGLSQARSKTGRKYSVDARDNKGVSFDIAVTVVDSKVTHKEGAANAGLKAGLIEVVGAKAGLKLEDKEENSQVSRIQFTVDVPHQTEEEERADLQAWQQSNQNVIEDQNSRPLNPYF